MIPKPGKINMYTSGWPKNQNKCWYKTGSPPPAGSKKVVLKLRSVNRLYLEKANLKRDSPQLYTRHSKRDFRPALRDTTTRKGNDKPVTR